MISTFAGEISKKVVLWNYAVFVFVVKALKRDSASSRPFRLSYGRMATPKGGSTSVGAGYCTCLQKRAVANQTNFVNASKVTLGKLGRDGEERIIMGFSECIDVILN